MSKAGGSAQEKYERLAARHREGRTRRLIVNFTVAFIAGAAFWVFSASQGYTFGPWVAGMIVFVGIANAIIEPSHARAWGIGAEGERITARVLEGLPDGHHVLNDRRILGSSANIDHIVIGPGGVFVVESKRLRGKFQVRGDTVFVAGRRTAMVEEVLREVEAVRQALVDIGMEDVRVHPLLYLQEADLPWFMSKPRGVPILMGRGLVRHIRSAPTVLDPASVTGIAKDLDHRLRPMVPAAEPAMASTPVAALPAPHAEPAASDPVLAACPRCGKDMVLRRNRKGQAFLGCSQFPLCKGTRPWREAPKRF